MIIIVANRCHTLSVISMAHNKEEEQCQVRNIPNWKNQRCNKEVSTKNKNIMLARKNQMISKCKNPSTSVDNENKNI